MSKRSIFLFIQLFSIVYIIQMYVCTGNVVEEKVEDTKEVKKILSNLTEELHSLYKDAIENEKTNVTRRIYTTDGHTLYTLHVQKLREVNGVKTHNLKVIGRSKDEEPVIYINNPVEAQMPNPFLGIEEFKKVMFDRVENQKKEFIVKTNPPTNHINQFKVKHIDNVHSKIFDVQKHVKKEVEEKHKAENLKQTTHKRNRKVTKKRKSKSYLSHTTKSTLNSTKTHSSMTTKTHKKTTTTIFVPNELINTENDDETVTKTVASKDVTKESIVGKKITTATKTDEKPTTIGKITSETIAEGDINSIMVAIGDIFTESITGEKRTAASVAVKDITTKTTGEQEKTKATVVDKDITTETSPKEKKTTETSPKEEITTETSPEEEITTETSPEEEITTEREKVADKEVNTKTVPVTTTEAIVHTTTETTVTTKRTRQARPYVFMGN